MNPRKMQQMMKKMGIQQTEIDAQEVIIRCADKEIIVHQPQVSKVNMMGQETLQIVGELEERPLGIAISDEDVETVAEQAGVSLEVAREALESTGGDLAQAILQLNNE
ncbi:nascent polypeptide-associated complex protein [Candidatus Woesearchaeota archaeon]|nr:MAG: nascent polypeptide-associated complex protein [Candidatus Woesearchaeota archaeon]